MAFNNTIVARVAASIWGLKLGYATTQAALAQANASAGGLNSVINSAFNDSFSGVSDADIAATVVANLGLTGDAATSGTAYLVDQLGTVPDSERGAKISEVVAQFSALSADPTYGTAASAFNAKVAAATAYSGTAGTQDSVLGNLPSASSFNLTLGQDNITGTAAGDTFNAFIFDNDNTLQSADQVDGGAGTDTLFADMGSSQEFAVTPITSNVERILVRAESSASADGDNNPGRTGRVQIDAERITGADHFESNNSRADVIIEDVRILSSQITSDITIAMVETDPGHVDYGVYFDQYSLKNQASTSSTITLRSLDTFNTSIEGTPSLKESTYGGFKFIYIENGVTKTVTLGADSNGVIKEGPGSIQAALNLTQLVSALQAEVNLILGAGVATVELGDPYSVPDPVSDTNVTGNEILITTNAAGITIPATDAQVAAGSGWLSAGVAPPKSNFYTFFSTDARTTSSLVTSKVILDDVGRGSTGGDLVIGGLSTGATSSSLGVQRFEIEVRDNSKLESINSTNNTLREVTIKNGLTSNSGNAYVATVKDAGNLTVNGNSGANGANITGTGATGVGSVDTQDGTNDPLPGSAAQTARNFGFSDVRLIDGATMTGKLAFSAEVTSSSIAKYLNLKDIQALPAGDNVAFTYNGGTNDDALWVSIDSNAAASRSTIVAGREDFTFTASGGNGNDNLRVGISNLVGGSQAWYTNQKLNANITVDGGAGNDTIRTPGAGDAIILGGTGTDTVYADNTGALAVTAGTASEAGAVYEAAETAQLAAVQALVDLSNSTNSGANPAATPLGQPDTTVAELNTLNLLTPISFADTLPVAVPTRAALQGAIDTAFTNGAITVEQKLALYNAYHVVSGTITITTPTTLVARDLDLTAAPVDGSALSAADFTAGNSLLDTYITAAKAAAATADAADAVRPSQFALLTAQQQAVVNANVAVNAVASAEALIPNGTAVQLAGLNALRSALVLGATDAAVVAALTTAVANGIVAGPLAADPLGLYAAAGGGSGTIDAPEAFAVRAILDPLIAVASVANTTANAALTAAIAANDAAVRASASLVGASPVTGGLGNLILDENVRGTLEADEAADAALNALDNFTEFTLDPLTTVQSDLAALKSALSVGKSDLEFSILTAAAEAKGTIGVGDAATLNALSFVAVTDGGVVDATEKQAINAFIQALQEANTAAVDAARAEAATLQATVDAADIVAAKALVAANGAPVAGFADGTFSKAVYVVNTANQDDVTTTLGAGYVLAVNDERNVADLKSGDNDSYNMFNTKVTVTFKDLVATANVANTGYKTSDLQINQAIKDAINNDAVLNKLLVATDGPANSLVITSLIDGVHGTADLGIDVTLPLVASIPSTDLAAAAAVYGVAATDAAVLGVMTTNLTAFTTSGDYVDQLGESGAFGGNARLTGAASTTTSDNTITGGADDDVIVLGTTVGVTEMLSSNDTVVYGAAFGDDTIVHFQAGAWTTGGDKLNLSALGGNILGTVFNVNKSVNVEAETLANDTELEVAALFTDSATAQTHVYVAYDAATNVGTVYAVVDAAGAGNVTATLAGTIDLADTLWADLTVDNFVA